MVDVTGITTTIDELDALYNSNPTQATYFSKLALLELCGWIEQCMDNIITDCSNSKLSNLSNKTLVQKIIVEKTYGFHYNDHFRPMLMKLVGLVQLEQMETRIDVTGDLGILSSQLGEMVRFIGTVNLLNLARLCKNRKNAGSTTQPLNLRCSGWSKAVNPFTTSPRPWESPKT